jgi:hypothetical protein
MQNARSAFDRRTVYRHRDAQHRIRGSLTPYWHGNRARHDTQGNALRSPEHSELISGQSAPSGSCTRRGMKRCHTCVQARSASVARRLPSRRCPRSKSKRNALGQEPQRSAGFRECANSVATPNAVTSPQERVIAGHVHCSRPLTRDFDNEPDTSSHPAHRAGAFASEDAMNCSRVSTWARHGAVSLFASAMMASCGSDAASGEGGHGQGTCGSTSASCQFDADCCSGLLCARGAMNVRTCQPAGTLDGGAVGCVDNADCNAAPGFCCRSGACVSSAYCPACGQGCMVGVRGQCPNGTECCASSPGSACGTCTSDATCTLGSQGCPASCAGVSCGPGTVCCNGASTAGCAICLPKCS